MQLIVQELRHHVEASGVIHMSKLREGHRLLEVQRGPDPFRLLGLCLADHQLAKKTSRSLLGKINKSLKISDLL